MTTLSPDTESKKHSHGEAFMLMTYACKCGHQEVVWNSRDGVTPFGMGCPSCGRASLQHVNWKGDVYAPGHKLHRHQRFWRDGTPDEAEQIMRRRIEKSKGTAYECPPDHAAELIKSARDGIDEFRPGWPMLESNP